MAEDIWLVFSLILVASAVAGWAVINIVERTAFFRAKLKHPKLTKAKFVLWWSPLLLLPAIVVGFGIGVFGGAVAWSWEYGGLTGIVGGGLNAAIVLRTKEGFKDGAARLFGKPSKKPMGEEEEP